MRGRQSLRTSRLLCAGLSVDVEVCQKLRNLVWPDADATREHEVQLGVVERVLGDVGHELRKERLVQIRFRDLRNRQHADEKTPKRGLSRAGPGVARDGPSDSVVEVKGAPEAALTHREEVCQDRLLKLRRLGTLKLRVTAEAADRLHQLLAFGHEQSGAPLAEAPGVDVVA